MSPLSPCVAAFAGLWRGICRFPHAGHLRIYRAESGQVIWEVDTGVPFKTVNGVAARGGSISGGVAPIAYKGALIVPSGYGFASKPPGNVLLVYAVE